LYKGSVQYAEPKTLWMNQHDGTFRDVSPQVGADFMRPPIGRGLCLADFDHDGPVDFAVSNNGGPAELWRTRVTAGNSWLGVTLIGAKSNRDAVGAKIALVAGGMSQFQQKLGGGSYAAASDPRLFFGLGQATKADAVRVVWPSGRKD